MSPLGKRLLGASCALLSLSACGSLLGGGDKAVLYRLGGDIPPDRFFGSEGNCCCRSFLGQPVLR